MNYIVFLCYRLNRVRMRLYVSMGLAAWNKVIDG